MVRLLFLFFVTVVASSSASGNEYVKNSRLGSIDLSGWEAELNASGNLKKFLVQNCNIFSITSCCSFEGGSFLSID